MLPVVVGSWYELVGLVRLLTPEECLEPGYNSSTEREAVRLARLSIIVE